MTWRLIIPVIVFGLTGCAELLPSSAAMTPPNGMTRPAPRPDGAAAPASGANTAEAFDTTSAAERAAAVAAPQPAGEARLGRTVATLGDPADPGFWIETPLAEQVVQGRVASVATGASVQVELRPIDGPDSAGSRISLPALRLLNVGLAGLHELDVFAGG